MLNEIKRKRDELVKLVEKQESRIKVLEQDEKIIEYKKITGEFAKNRKELEKMNFTIAENNMSECSHIFVITKIDKVWDGHRTDTINYYGCIKCGLDERYSNDDYKLFATPLQKEMEYIFRATAIYGISIRENCSLELGMAIYKGISKAHPNISNEMAIQYFHSVLHHMRKDCSTENIKENRIKRLGLKPNFIDWNAGSVIHNN